MKYQKVVVAFSLALGVALGSYSTAYALGGGTPDGTPPPGESACDGLTGRVWGLCVAYCEAQDCFESPGSEHPACDVLREKLEGITGSDLFPCDGGGGIG
jgi:hypothetical protein